MLQNRPYLLALVGQILFGFTLYGRNADVLYYFTYVEGNASYYTTYSMCIIIPSIIGAACFQPVFRKLNNKGRTASVFALLTGISMLSMFFFNVKKLRLSFMHCLELHSFSFPDSIPQFMQSFRIVWSTVSGKPDCATMDFNMRLFRLKQDWNGNWNSTSCRITRKIRVCGKPDTKCSRTFHYETCIYNHSGGSLDCDCCGIILFIG